MTGSMGGVFMPLQTALTQKLHTVANNGSHLVMQGAYRGFAAKRLKP
jgi:hypothetical protein